MLQDDLPCLLNKSYSQKQRLYLKKKKSDLSNNNLIQIKKKK